MKKSLQCSMLALTISFALAGAPTLALLGCGGGGAATVDEAAAAKSDLDKQLSSIKNLDEDTIASMADSDDFKVLEDYGISAEDFLKAFLANFDYSIGEVTVDGDKGTAEMSLSMTDVGTVMTTWQENVTTFMSSDEATKLYSEEGEDAVYQKVFQMLMDDLSAADAPTGSGSFTFDIAKTDGVWDVTDSQAVTDAMISVANMESLL